MQNMPLGQGGVNQMNNNDDGTMNQILYDDYGNEIMLEGEGLDDDQFEESASE